MQHGKVPAIVSVPSFNNQGWCKAWTGGANLISSHSPQSFSMSRYVYILGVSLHFSTLELRGPNLLRLTQGQRGMWPCFPLLHLMAPRVREALGLHCGCSLSTHCTWLLWEFLAKQMTSTPSITFWWREMHLT